jgi:hypothetical protein
MSLVFVRRQRFLDRRHPNLREILAHRATLSPDPTNRYCTTMLHERTSSLRPTVHFGRSLFALAAGFLRRRSLARAS